MNDLLLKKIHNHAISYVAPPPYTISGDPIPYPSASEAAIAQAEQELGFRIPALLKGCYSKIGNGGFGPGYGLIGVEGGYASDYGTIVETHNQLKDDQKLEGRRWKKGMLPFCEWGDNIFSCVNCIDAKHPIYTFEDFVARPQGYVLDTFFELWISGEDILAIGPHDIEQIEIINPFTGDKQIISRRRPI